MSSTPTRNSTNTNTSSSTYRVNYSDYVADITGSPKTTRKSASTGIGHHINPLHNPYPSRQNPPVQQTAGMPQYGGGSEKCARCSKPVYIAERKVGAGRAFHTSCFSCYTCKRKLDAGGLSEHKAEIYCKPCYTKQFGAHGLISGVTMSTEHPGTRQTPRSHRSSFSGDLDEPVKRDHHTIQRSSSNENIIHNRHSTTQNDEFAQKYPRRNDDLSQQNSSATKNNIGLNVIVDTKYPRHNDDLFQQNSSTTKNNVGLNAIVDTKYSRPNSILSEQNLPSNRNSNGLNAIVDTKYQRSPSPIGFQNTAEPMTFNDRQRLPYGDDDRSKYIHKGEQLSYGSGASAMINIPIVTQPQRTDSTLNRIHMPVDPIRDNQRSRSPSITSNDSYRRQSSREQLSDFADNNSRFNINENNTNRINQRYSNDSTTSFGNPVPTRNFHHISTSSYESTERTSAANRNPYEREQYHPRESSPPLIAYRNQSPSPTTGYTSLITARNPSSTYGVGPSRDSPSTHVPQQDYLHTQTSTNSRQSTSSQHTDRSSFGLNEFVSKTNIAGHGSPSGGPQFSALSALVGKPRQQNYDDYDD